MITYRSISAMFMVCVAEWVFTGAALAAPPVIRYAGSADSGHATVSGTSTLHNWTMTSTAIGGSAAFVSPESPDFAISSIDLTIDVHSLKSSEGSGMDKNAYTALKSKEYPVIRYHLSGAQPRTRTPAQGLVREFNAAGDLTIAGTKRAVSLHLFVQPGENGQMSIRTHAELNMSDFGIKPPTAMLGMIKSGNAITVEVVWQLTPQPANGGSQ